MRRVLFLCSRNQWRSPTAEAIYQNDPRVEVRSAGVSASAKRRVNEKLLRWADLVVVMEPDHKRRLHSQFPELAPDLAIEVLGIPDDYAFMDPDLVDLIRDRTEAILAEPDEPGPQAASDAFQP
ncbi:MAG: low molecular weight protein tyrosine phosphatase family protein [Roseimicrobium sp.]|jgi:protein-tyrosine-phosphatase